MKRPPPDFCKVRSLILLALCLVGSSFGPNLTVRGDFVMSLTPDPINATQGDTGFFEILLSQSGTGTVTSGNINFFGFEIQAPTGVLFTSYSTTTSAATYLFQGLNATLQTNPDYAPPVTSLPFGVLRVDGLGDTAADSRLMNGTAPNNQFSLGRIGYSVNAGATPGSFPISFLNLGLTTDLADDLGDPIAFSVTNGTINISPSAVPEPSSVALGALATCLIAGLHRRNRRAKA